MMFTTTVDVKQFVHFIEYLFTNGRQFYTTL